MNSTIIFIIGVVAMLSIIMLMPGDPITLFILPGVAALIVIGCMASLYMKSDKTKNKHAKAIAIAAIIIIAIIVAVSIIGLIV